MKFSGFVVLSVFCVLSIGIVHKVHVLKGMRFNMSSIFIVNFIIKFIVISCVFNILKSSMLKTITYLWF